MKKIFLLILLVSFALYLLPEIFFENAMLYISGGIVGGTINEVLEIFTKSPSDILIFFIWIVLLAGVVFLFFRLQNKLLRYFLIAIVVLLLYVIDNILAFIPIYEMSDIKQAVFVDRLVVLFSILSKSLLLSVIVYYGLYRNKEAKSLE